MSRAILNRCACIAAIVSQVFSTSVGFAGDLFNGWGNKHPRTSVMEMAATIDKLEKEIDEFGSIVAKQPDVWGEARWTQHRQQYETQMKDELTKFQFTLNARQAQADSAFFIDAMALGTALSGGTGSAPPAGNSSISQVISTAPASATDTFGFTPLTLAQAKPLTAISPRGPTATPVTGISIEPTEYLNQLSTYLGHLNQLRRVNEGDDTADAAGYALNLIRLPVSVLPGHKTRTGHGAEVTFTLTPELTDNLLADTFRNLVINDLVDQLGLPVVKLAEQRPWEQDVPQAIVQSQRDELKKYKELQEVLTAFQKASSNSERRDLLKHAGQIADATIGSQIFTSINAKDCPEARREVALMRAQLRQAVVNALAQASSEMTLDEIIAFALSNKELYAAYPDPDPNAQTLQELVAKTAAQSPNDLLRFGIDSGKVGKIASLQEKPKLSLEESNDKNILLEDNISTIQSSIEKKSTPELMMFLSQGNEIESRVARHSLDSRIQKATSKVDVALNEVIPKIVATIETAVASVNSSISIMGISSAVASMSAPRDRRARYAVSPTEIACVFGINELTAIARDLDQLRETQGRSQLQLTDAQGFLVEELEAAYRLLAELQRTGWDGWPLCSHISQAVGRLQYKGTSTTDLEGLRTQFYCGVKATGAAAACENSCRGDTVRALAWAILVESALLNDRLVHDMQRVQTATGVQFLPECVPAFYYPAPEMEASRVFNEYVRVRWPIHVFAIDPVIGEQNVSDALSRRRETQLALSLAFTQGRMSAQNFSRFARRVDYELDTIALNRTIVGFSHGSDTFGWRMTPRVQTPPIETNAKVFFRDLLIGPPGRDHDLKKRQIEPGMREMLAIVIMPAFVPQARLDVRTSWFELTSPDKKKFKSEDSVRMGQMVQYIRNCKAQYTTEEAMNRPGEIRRLLTAVDQLEKRLPLQDTMVQIPYENSEGGFQLFSEGTRNLGPELIGFYGEPGLDPSKGGSLFLVGRNFNVNVTQVIIGGQTCSDFTLLSREVMAVKVPKDLNVVEVTEFIRGVPGTHQVIDAHLATPYGVSSHLHIPVYRAPAAAKSPYEFSAQEVSGCLTFNGCIAESLAVSQRVNISGLKLDDEIACLLVAIMQNGRERALNVGQPPNAPATSKNVLKVTTSGAVGFPFEQLRDFFGGTEKILANDRPIVLKLSATVSSKGPDGSTVKVALPNPLIIRLNGCGSGGVSVACAPCAAAAAISVPAVPTVGMPELPIPSLTESPFDQAAANSEWLIAPPR